VVVRQHVVLHRCFLAELPGWCRIPDGAYGLFRRVSQPTSGSNPVLVRHMSGADSDTGGEFTVKLYSEQQAPAGKRVRCGPSTRRASRSSSPTRTPPT